MADPIAQQRKLQAHALHAIASLTQALGAPQDIYLEDGVFTVYVARGPVADAWIKGLDLGRPEREASTIPDFDRAYWPPEFPRTFGVRATIPALPVLKAVS